MSCVLIIFWPKPPHSMITSNAGDERRWCRYDPFPAIAAGKRKLQRARGDTIWTFSAADKKS